MTMSDLVIGDDELEFCLGSSLKDVRARPHIVAQSGSEFLACILDATGCRGALWGGNAPIADSKGDPLVNADVLTRFRAWDIGKNQSWLRRQGAFAVLGQFSMVIPISTTDEVVSRMYAEVECNGIYGLYFDDCLAKLVQSWVGDLDWSYVPLTDESDLALWLTSTSESLADKVRSALAREGIPAANW